MQELLTSFWYLPLALGLFVGGTPVLIAALYLVIAGTLSGGVLFVASLSTTLLWDIIWYMLGCLHVSYLLKAPWFKKRAHFIEPFISRATPGRYVMWFGARFMYGLSSVSAVLSGVARMRLLHFVPLGAASMSVWFLVLYALAKGVEKGRPLIDIGFTGFFFIFWIVTILLALGLRELYKFIMKKA